MLPIAEALKLGTREEVLSEIRKRRKFFLDSDRYEKEVDAELDQLYERYEDLPISRSA